MQDRMTYKDHVAMKLECGHPYVKPGETCKHCGKVLPPLPEEEKLDEKQQEQEQQKEGGGT